MPRSRTPGLRRAGALAPALLLVGLALWEMAAAARAGASVPEVTSWRGAAALVRAAHRPGDLILFAPRWLDPLGRLHLGDLIPPEMAGRMDAARFARIWELSARGARAAETAGLVPAAEWQVGSLTVRRFERTPVRMVSDFLPLLGAAQVDGHWDRRPELVFAEVGFAPHRCIQVVPRPGHAVRIRFAGVLLGSELVGHVGLADVFTRRDVRAPGHLAVEIDGQPRVSVRAGVDDGWRRFVVPTRPGQRAEVVFVARADAGARDRRICFAAEARQ
jgi:hypothetical protein